AGFGDSVGFGPTWLMMTRPRPPALRGARGRKRPGPLGPGGRMHFGVLVFDQVEELDFVGPWEMLGMWKKVAGGPEPLIVARSRAAVACAKGLSVNPHVAFADCPTLDYLLVPGGQGTRTEVSNEALLGFIRTQAQSCRGVLSVCTGAFLLHAAGLLGGKRAT